jgi:hypothetical protein
MEEEVLVSQVAEANPQILENFRPFPPTLGVHGADAVQEIVEHGVPMAPGKALEGGGLSAFPDHGRGLGDVGGKKAYVLMKGDEHRALQEGRRPRFLLGGQGNPEGLHPIDLPGQIEGPVVCSFTQILKGAVAVIAFGE